MWVFGTELRDSILEVVSPDFARVLEELRRERARADKAERELAELQALWGELQAFWETVEGRP